MAPRMSELVGDPPGPRLAVGTAVRHMPWSGYVAAYTPKLRRFYWITEEAFIEDESGEVGLAEGLEDATVSALRSLGLITEREESQ